MQTSHVMGKSSFDITQYTNKLKSSQFAQKDSAPKTEKTLPDSVFLNKLQPEQAREFLHSHITRSISEEKPSASDTSKTQTPYTRNYPDAETTASKIIDDVNQAASPLQASDVDKRDNLQSLINKIQQGFQEAKDALDKLSVMKSSFNSEFDDIQKKVNDFLHFLDSPEQTIETTELAASSMSYLTSSQANIQIETRDGDIVTIDLTSRFFQQQNNASIDNNNFSGYIYEAYTENSNSLAFTVSGELDEDELAAISTLVGDIANTVGKFEQGDVTAALNLAKNINSQAEELSSFSFSVQTTEQYQAINLYEKTQSSQSTAKPQTNSSPKESQYQSGYNNVNSSISNIIYTAESINISNATTTVNNIFEKFYEQLSSQTVKTNSREGHDQRESKDKDHEEKHVREH